MAMLVALSAVGATIKFPSLTGTPALDSLPGFLAAFLLGPGQGAAVAALGHLLTAYLSGFPMTLPVHGVVALEMAGVAAVAGRLRRRRGLLAATAWIVVGNGLLAPAPFLLWPGFGPAFVAAMLGPLLVASALNGVGAALLYAALGRLPATLLAPFAESPRERAS